MLYKELTLAPRAFHSELQQQTNTYGQHTEKPALSLGLKEPGVRDAQKLAQNFRAEKRSAQASAHPLSQAQGGLFCVLATVCLFVSERVLTKTE